METSNVRPMNEQEIRVQGIEMAIECMVNKRFYSGTVVEGANSLLNMGGDGVTVEFHHVSAVMRDLRAKGIIKLIEYRGNRNYYIRSRDVLTEGLKAPTMLQPITVCTALEVDRGVDNTTAQALITYMRTMYPITPDELATLRSQALDRERTQGAYNALKIKQGEREVTIRRMATDLADKRVAKVTRELNELKHRLTCLVKEVA